MSLPKQVKQQIDEAKRIEDELRKQKEPTTAEPVQPVEANPAEAQPTAAEVPPPQPATTSEIAPQTPPAPQPVTTVSKQQYDELVHQYRTLQGIHRSLVQARADLEQRVAALNNQVNALQQQVRIQTPAPQTPATKITDAEVEEYGAELIGVIEKKAREVAAPIQAKLDQAEIAYRQLAQRNKQLEAMLQGVSKAQSDSSEEKFFGELQRIVPDWETLNYDSGFLAWLNQPNPFRVNESRKQGLDAAVNSFDASAASVFFKAYRAENPASPRQPKAASNAQPVSVPSLESQAQPTQRSTPDSSRPVPQGRIWSQAEIQKFYRDVTDGKYRTNPSEKQRLEREIYTAQKENRIAA